MCSPPFVLIPELVKTSSTFLTKIPFKIQGIKKQKLHMKEKRCAKKTLMLILISA